MRLPTPVVKGLSVCVCMLQMKSEIAYARSKGIEVGGYDLIVLTRDSVPDYWRDIGGDGSCIASNWYRVYILSLASSLSL